MFYPHQQPAQGPLPTPDQLQPQGGTPASGMFTRNLIGSLTVSAFMLNDPEDKRGIWFVLQDLSVRTEGSFRYAYDFLPFSHESTPTALYHMVKGDCG